MFVIMAYDINEERVRKVLKVARKYLHWVQKSLFEGNLSTGKYHSLLKELKKILNEKEDSVRFYLLLSRNSVKIENLGKESRGETIIL